MQKAVQDNITKWVNHLTSGSADLAIPSKEISVAQGLKDQRLMIMKRHADQVAIGAVLMAQIKSLRDFLNVKTTLNEDQMGETARMIVDEFDDMSFTSIMDCFNKIKRAQPPFHEKLYESLDGRKIMEYLTIYRLHQTEFLENTYKDHQQQKEFNLSGLAKSSPKVVEGLKDLSQQLRYDALSKRDQQKVQISKTDKIVKGWIQEFDQLKQTNESLQGIGQLDLYLEKRMAEYNELQNRRP